MVIVQINQTYKIGSTGKIMYDLNQVIQTSGHESYMVAGYSNDTSPQNLYCANKKAAFFPIRKDQVIFRISGVNGYRYKKRTQKIIEWIDRKHPDIIHLHNIHGDWIHLQTLFDYIKRKHIPVVWTLHDCWAFTGRCSHFELCGCEKWKYECNKCTNKKVYPITYLFDWSRKMFLDKKQWFIKPKNMAIVTPSKWLAEYVRLSFLGKYPVKTIHNGIDTLLFKPLNTQSKYYSNVGKKKIILGVASSWSPTKGFNDFLKLDKLIDHTKYIIVLVGLNAKQMKSIPPTIIGISRTNNQQELAELYSGADVFVNPTYQDNYPTTNLEAQCCGTPCITYNTGGSPESIFDANNVIEKGNIRSLKERIIKVCTESEKPCIENSSLWHFSKTVCFDKYIELYTAILEGEK